MSNAAIRVMRRVMMATGIGRLLANTDESRSTPTVQVALSAGEIRSDVPLMQQYGLASRPVPGSDAIVIFTGGDRTRGIAIATGDQRGRPADLQPGEVCLYHPQTGSRIWLKEDGSIALDPANHKVTTPGDFTAGGTITGNEVAAGTIKLTQHIHGGVMAGLDETERPI